MIRVPKVFAVKHFKRDLGDGRRESPDYDDRRPQAHRQATANRAEDCRTKRRGERDGDRNDDERRDGGDDEARGEGANACDRIDVKDV